MDHIQSQTFTFILGGGEGQRLYPLTRNRAKPAVSFGGHRLIDFTIANCLNSGLRRIRVLTQYQCESLHNYLRECDLADPAKSDGLDSILCLCPVSGKRYRGTADAVQQNLFELEKANPSYVAILCGDHVYRMDYRKLLDFHKEHGGDVTVGLTECPIYLANNFGVAQLDSDLKVTAFEEKPAHPVAMPRNLSKCLVSMGVYVFNTQALIRSLSEDEQHETNHDFGRNVIPQLVRQGKVHGYNFTELGTELGTYWRDIGTIDAYYRASMDLLLKLWSDRGKPDNWPLPGSGMAYANSSLSGVQSAGFVLDSVTAGDASIDPSAKIAHSVISPSVRVDRLARVENSVLLRGAHIGVGARVRRAIIDEGTHVAAGVDIGYDLNSDRAAYTVSESGVVVAAEKLIAARPPDSIEAFRKSRRATGGFPEAPGQTA